MHSTTIDGRVDHQFTSNNLAFARYTSNYVNSVIPTGLPSAMVNGVSINPGNGQYGYAGPAKNQATNTQLNFTHIFSPNLVDETKAGYTRPNLSSSPFLASRPKAAVGSQWVSETAFTYPEVGTIGTDSRNNPYGPHFQHLDLSIFKDFSIVECAKVEFRAESFNLLNHPNFFIANDQNHDQSTHTLTGITGTIQSMSPNYTPRELQFALKLIF
jgi:hypothetical protein